MEKQAMTPQEELHAVSTAIRKALPRLMELREGVILKRKRHFELYSDHVILKIKRDDFSTYTEIDGKHKGSFSIENEKLLDYFEIIGHDILLSDVLEWLAREHNNIEIFLMNNGIMLINFREDKLDKGKLDLSKPRLADQSEELWEFLYNLLEDNE